MVQLVAKRMGASSQEKRKYPRVQAKNVSAHLNVANQSSPCTIQNISAGGLFIQTTEVLPPGMSVTVNLARPGWTRVLRLSGRVVWALAEKTAAKKGTVPGMRIKFDPLGKESARLLVELLDELGAVGGLGPPVSRDEREKLEKRDPNAITQPVSIKEIQARVSSELIPIPTPSITEPAPMPLLIPKLQNHTVQMPPPSPPPGKKPRPSGPRGLKQRVATPVVVVDAVSDATLPAKLLEVSGNPLDTPLQPYEPAPMVLSNTPLRLAQTPIGALDTTQPAKPPQELLAELQQGTPAADQAPRLQVQVQGLIMQLGEMQQQLDSRDKELEALRKQLSTKQTELDKADRERKAAELAIQRLSMQLASRR